ncbi:hypothetical protein [Candidatus Pelagibacter sp.]|uniref:hypothetical protein n=1 Tax=Candidatus Pelagibacter sp. TaxID=2024849 RepID=UPI003F8633D5
MRILLILFFALINIEVWAEDFKWKLKKTVEHENYYENYGTGIKKTKIDGKNKKLKFELREFFPIETARNSKEEQCKDFRIQEITYKSKMIEQSYSLNDCLPCIDKGAGYMCAYPYFQVFYFYEDYGIFDPTYAAISDNLDITNDGAKLVYISINIGSREQVRFSELKTDLESLGVGKAHLFKSQIFKYNTRLRKIESEKSKLKNTQNQVFEMVFTRIKDNTLNNIANKTKLNIREKDLKILFSAEPSLSITKFQTRD